MRVNIGSFGRFYTFDLARQMQKRNLLGSMYTAYPRWKVDDLPSDRVSCFPWWMLATTAASRLGKSAAAAYRWLSWRSVVSFDEWVAKNLSACDVYHCLSACGLQSHRVARQRYGALTVCDRGSSHMRYQDRLLAEEHERWGLPYRKAGEIGLSRELQEYEECDLITVPSGFAYRSFIAEGIRQEKLRKISFGVDLRMFHPVPKQDNVFRVLYVGAISVRKGILYMLQALEPLFGEIEVWAVGSVESALKPLLAKYEGKVRFLGPIPRPELYRYYSQGSVMVLPSLEEGLALVQSQAMACGVPVIGSTNSGAEDLFNNGVEGYIVPIRDPEAIREKILHLYRNPELRYEMGKAALRRVRSIGGWDSYGEKMRAVYEEALLARGMETSRPTALAVGL